MVKRQVGTSKSIEDDNSHQTINDLEAPLLEKSNYNKGDDNDTDDEKVIDARCHLLNKSYLFGILSGVVLQGASFLASNFIKSAHLQNVVLAFVLYVFTKYWMPIAILLPAAVVAVRSRSLPGHLRLEAFFESLRFQLGLFFGSLLLLSLVNFYALANTAPLPLLLSYYAVCLAVSFIALCLLQIFVNEVCANVSSIEVVINYEESQNKNKNRDLSVLQQ
mmetsp:Transcript_2121/g.3545  ORF Transcript_2121/g.3545 Transcript_2121/m.3545 type:complete len:220 (+) Transcript_2121:64-723(+)